MLFRYNTLILKSYLNFRYVVSASSTKPPEGLGSQLAASAPAELGEDDECPDVVVRCTDRLFAQEGQDVVAATRRALARYAGPLS